MRQKRLEVIMAMQSLRSPVAGFLTIAAFSVGLSSASSATDVANTIRYGVEDAQNINRLPQVIAEREGLFAREGLTVEIVAFTPTGFRAARTAPGGQNGTTTAGTPTSIRDAMLKGSIDMQRQQLPLLINAVLAGGKFVGVAVTANNPVYYLVARSEIRSFADLKGKTISITGPNDGITIWTRKLMALHGLKNEDVRLKGIAGSEARVDCLKSGECAAASLAQPEIFGALESGNHTLGVTNEDGPQLYQVDVVNPIWAAAHRDLVVKYIRATTAAMHFIQDPKNRNEVVKVTMAYMNQPEDRAQKMLAYIWDPKNRVFQQASPDMNNVKAMIALLGEYDIVKQPLPMPERFVDASYGSAAGQ